MKVILVGKGPGKTVTAMLLALTHVTGTYDADPYSALTEVYPQAEPYRPKALVPPSVVDTTMVDSQARTYLKLLDENPDAWTAVIATPFRQQLAATKRVLEDIREQGNARVKGVVVNMAADRKEAEGVAEKLGTPLIGWLPLSKELEEQLAGREPFSSPDGLDKKLLERVRELGKSLGLQERGTGTKKKRRALFGR